MSFSSYLVLSFPVLLLQPYNHIITFSPPSFLLSSLPSSPPSLLQASFPSFLPLQERQLQELHLRRPSSLSSSLPASPLLPSLNNNKRLFHLNGARRSGQSL